MINSRFKFEGLFCQLVAGSCLGKSTLVNSGIKIKKHYGNSTLKGISIIPSNGTDLYEVFQNWRSEDKIVGDIADLLSTKDYLYIFLDMDGFPGTVDDYISMEFMTAYVNLLVSQSILRELTNHKFRFVALTHGAHSDLESDEVIAFVSNNWILRQKRFLFRSGRELTIMDSMKQWQDKNYGMKKGSRVDLGDSFILDYFLNPDKFTREIIGL